METALSNLIPTLLQNQKKFFKTKATRHISFRIKYLKKLKATIEKYEEEVFDALWKDLRKSKSEAFTSEVGLVYNEIDETVRRLPKWSKPRIVGTPLFFLPATSKLHPEPYGNTLVIAPWNYPFLLLLSPIIGAISAGNTVVCKPSEMSPATSDICKKILDEAFPSEYVSTVLGGIPESTALLNERWDYIFFTGSTMVGRIVYQAAAKHLTPVTLELGGKSPCIVDKDIHVENTARRLVWGKLLNAGQTCIAPDYLLVHKDIKKELVEKIKEKIAQFYSENPRESQVYPRIINERHFDRLNKLIDPAKVVVGGKTDKKDKYIAPTLMDNVTWEDAVMQEEIFGPILPMIEWRNIEEVIDMVNSKEKPLALYVFSKHKSFTNRIIKECPSGNATVNDTILHIANHNLPFGGVGESGIGSYHGKYSFDTFSHLKGVLHKSNHIDPDLRYPNSKASLSQLRTLVKRFL